ncbi:HTH domain-containing protein [Paenibacillus pinihumi]|uniref:LexA family protein n=1 Tax=Paenibacillus pinihumi TaxID=669462 RepID=UPI0009DC17A3
MGKITPKQKRVLNFIVSFVSQHNYPPTLREIGAELNITSTSTIHAYLTRLQNNGFIRWEPSAPRTIRVLVNAE